MPHYRDQTNGGMQRMFDQTTSIKDGFRKLLYGLAAETREQHERGCLPLSANCNGIPATLSSRNFCAITIIGLKPFLKMRFCARETKGDQHEAGSEGSRSIFCSNDSGNESHGQASFR